MEWKELTGKYQISKALYLGAYHVATVFWNGCRSKDDPKVYKLTCKLPGIKQDLGNFEHEKEAMDRAEAVAAHWIARVGLKM